MLSPSIVPNPTWPLASKRTHAAITLSLLDKCAERITDEPHKSKRDMPRSAPHVTADSDDIASHVRHRPSQKPYFAAILAPSARDQTSRS
jgi:hypothetical protein